MFYRCVVTIIIHAFIIHCLHSTDNQPEMDNASGSGVLTPVLIAALLCVLVVGLLLVTTWVTWKKRLSKKRVSTHLPMLPSSAYLAPTSPTAATNNASTSLRYHPMSAWALF